MLDLGCAFGFFLDSLGPGYVRTGLDMSREAVALAATRMPDARLAVADCSRAPFSAQFDGIVAFDVLEHVPALDDAAQYVVNALRSDGVFVFVVPVYDGPLGPVVRALDRDPTHVHKRSREWWLEWAARYFDLVSWTGILRYLILPGYYLHVPSRAIRGISPAIAVVVRRRA